MLKVLILDDEPKIRNGLCNLIKWDEYGMVIVGTAKNGREALKIVEEEKPDICLVDICMPIMDGIDFIRELNERNSKSLNIIVSGHDEFEYAQQAVKLKAFDYILKPITKEALQKVISNAKQQLEKELEKEKQYELARALLEKNMPVLRYRFISDWLNGCLTSEEVIELLDFHGIKLSDKIGLIVIKVTTNNYESDLSIETHRQLQLCVLQNIFEEALERLKPFIINTDENDNFVAVVSVIDNSIWDNIQDIIKDKVSKLTASRLSIYKRLISERITELSEAYEDIKKEILKEYYCLPIINKVKSLIDKDWRNSDLSLNTIAKHMDISTSHLSKLFKQELGMPFIDYLIKIRISEAVRLLNEPHIKVNEVAERVGYSSQHYFCSAFKKVLGITPSEYRRKENKEL